MPLKTFVKVGNITNLSDARYCAGMGVDMLGFGVIEGQKGHISAKLFQEIRGWVSGPKVVAEMYGLTPDSNLRQIAESYAPDFAELSFQEYKTYHSSLSLPLIVCLRDNEIIHSDRQYPGVAYWLIDEAAVEQIKGKKLSHPVLLQLTAKDNIQRKLEHYPIKGVALLGSPEMRPGYKDYDNLADVLEQLEELP